MCKETYCRHVLDSGSFQSAVYQFGHSVTSPSAFESPIFGPQIPLQFRSCARHGKYDCSCANGHRKSRIIDEGQTTMHLLHYPISLHPVRYAEVLSTIARKPACSANCCCYLRDLMRYITITRHSTSVRSNGIPTDASYDARYSKNTMTFELVNLAFYRVWTSS
jgi:hypothetical protein